MQIFASARRIRPILRVVSLLPGRPAPSFSSTSDISSCMVACGSARHAMYSSRNPKNVYSTNAALFTTLWLMRFGTINPSAVESTVMTASAPMAPAKTITRGCRMAMIAAMMNASSPSSDARSSPGSS